YYEIADDVPQRLVGDSLRLAQVLDNLIGNALKFTPRGEIVLAVRTRARDTDGVRLQFSVSDTGIGLTTDQARGLFDGYAQTEASTARRRGGPALGLAICRRLVEMMDGTIAVHSAPGEGSTFDFDVRFDLPGVRRERDLHGVRGSRVLVLEEQDTGRLILQQHFQSWHLQVAVARDLDDARQKLRRAPPGEPYDVIVTDWKTGGIALAQWAHALAAERGDRAPAVVLLAPLAACEDALDALAPWAATSGVLARPITPSRLFEAIVRLRASAVARPLFEATKGLELSDLMRTLRGAHVLLVEDNIVNQQVAEAFLFLTGLRVTVATNGLEAVDRVKETQFDAVLMDLQMPLMDGDEATRVIRALPGRARLPIIAMSAAATDEDRQLCLASGMDAHLGKPVDPRELARVLLAWIPARPQPREAAGTISAQEAPGQENA
ncbi:MAG TPA: response regulator, partial [Burkholderiaceae bacterium]|nr:response regulator [Burkholderiaceae bacterium]